VRVTADRRTALRAGRVWSDEDVAGLPVFDAPVTTVGGGLASLALVQTLRVAGVPARDLRVVSPAGDPAESFRHLAHAAQLDDKQRLRSDSATRMDAVWGFPGYALEEAAARRSVGPLWRVFAEPLGVEVFTPVSGHVYQGIAAEAERLAWTDMLLRGRVTMIRPRCEGGFFSLVDDGHRRSVVRSRYVHLGPGYAGLRLTEELARYRAHHGDGFSCVHAYEPHDHVYRVLARTGGTVVVRGTGITASRVIERLIDVRDRSGREVHVLHVARRPARRPGADAAAVWDHQPFNFPKAALGGQLAAQIASTHDDEARGDLITALAGTTTPSRRSWRAQLRRGHADGFYRVLIGNITDLSPAPGGGVRLRVRDGQTPDLHGDLHAAFLIDCTGLMPDVAAHPLVDDLFRAGLARTNAHGRMAVDENFEIREARNGAARLFATGAMTFGSRVGPVDSFWGLQAGALRVCDELARLGFCDRIGMRRSVGGWWRWLRGRAA
jgi:hypothetical protein